MAAPSWSSCCASTSTRPLLSAPAGSKIRKIWWTSSGGRSGSGGKTEQLSICAVAAPAAVDYADTGAGDVPSLKLKLLVSG
jgi:hypothetical protein